MLDSSPNTSPRFSLDADQIAARDMARAFADEHFAPYALDWDEARHFPVAEMRKAAALGMGGIFIAEDVGGSGLSRLTATLIFEALATRVSHGRRLYVDPQHDDFADRCFWHGGAAPKLAAEIVHHGAVGELLPDRAGRRIGCRSADRRARCATAIITCSTGRSNSSPVPARAISMS